MKNYKKYLEEIEERKKSLFITLTYPHELKKNDIIMSDNFEINFYNEVVFVAIKNGMHDTKGYVFCSPDSKFEIPKEAVHVSKLFDIICNYY